MNHTMKVVIALLGLIAMAGVVIALIRREQRSTAIEEALASGLEPGMRLDEATALLEQLAMPYTVDTTPEGNTLVRYRREEAYDGRGSRVSEQQLLFDREGLLRDTRGVTQISSP